MLRTGETVRVENVFRESQYSNQDVDEKVGIVSKTFLCCPLLGPGGEVRGVLQLCNRRDGQGTFTEEDEVLALGLGKYVACSLAADLLLQQLRERVEETPRILGERLGIVLAPKEVPILDLPLLLKAAAASLVELLGVGTAEVFLFDPVAGEAYRPSLDGPVRSCFVVSHQPRLAYSCRPLSRLVVGRLTLSPSLVTTPGFDAAASAPDAPRGRGGARPPHR